jgi:quercetin dioxygenase-like cupin family protein
MNPEETVSLAGLVDYQDDSVVSRTLMKKETGTLTVFAFEAGQALSEHRAPFDALVQVLEGEAVITISGKEHPVRAGEAILMPAQDPHAVKANVRFKMLLTMLRS